MNKQHALAGLLAFLLTFSMAFVSHAAEKKPAAAQRDPQAPITVQADKLYFNDKTGEVYAQGNVKITQNQDTVLGEYIQGNARETKIWVDGAATLIQPGVKLTGSGIAYNYGDQTGTAQKANGKIDRAFVTGKDIELAPQHYTLRSGTASGCPDPDPHYHISADKIEIWPGDKMISYNAKFWIGKMVIFSLPKVETSLKPSDSEASAFPRIGYSTDDGVTISQHLEMPISPNLGAYTDMLYLSKHGFKPVYGLISRQSAYTVKLYKGSMRNSDEEWIKKDHELSLQFNPYRIANTSLTANLAVSTGEWTQDDISGRRQDYSLYFANDPIRLGDKLTMDVGTGVEKVYYGYNDSTNDIWRFNIKFIAQASPRLDVWTGYAYNHQSGISVYEFDKIDVPREWSGGFMYKLDSKNSFGIEMDYDLDRSRVEDLDYIWIHNLHCIEAKVMYRAERDQLSLKVAAVNW